MPIQLRDQVVAKTHGEVFLKIKFFGGRKKEFTTAVVHELKPINVGANEVLYQSSDSANEIYFLHTGQVKLYVDCNDYITDEDLLNLIREKEKKQGENSNI